MTAAALVGCLLAVRLAGTGPEATVLRDLCGDVSGSGCVLVVGSRECSHCDQAMRLLLAASEDWRIRLVVPDPGDDGEPTNEPATVVRESTWLDLVREGVPTIRVVPRDGLPRAFASASLALRALDARRHAR